MGWQRERFRQGLCIRTDGRIDWIDLGPNNGWDVVTRFFGDDFIEIMDFQGLTIFGLSNALEQGFSFNSSATNIVERFAGVEGSPLLRGVYGDVLAVDVRKPTMIVSGISTRKWLDISHEKSNAPLFVSRLPNEGLDWRPDWPNEET